MFTRDERGAALLGGVPLDSLFDGAAIESRTRARPGSLQTPAYAYDLDAMADETRGLVAGFGGAPHLVAYAVKANSAGAVVRAIASAGAGAEVVSGGELGLALAAGIAADDILQSGVAKRDDEIDLALGAGPRGIRAIQVESVEEIARIEARAAALGRRARVSLRLNPGVDADTHEKVATGHDEAKFGVALEDLDAALESLGASRHVDLVGVGAHVGSQLTETGAYLEAASVVCDVAERCEAKRGGRLAFVDFGGGFGVDYGAGCRVRPADFAAAAVALLARRGLGHLAITVEPGRSLVAAHGVLCASVVSVKRSRSGRRWLLVDAGMNDLIRPALYGAHHRVEPMSSHPAEAGSGLAFRVVGPVCESSDDFGAHRFDEPPPARVVFRDAGAYGFTMASEYNGRPLPTEVFLAGGRVASIRHARSAADWAVSRG